MIAGGVYTTVTPGRSPELVVEGSPIIIRTYARFRTKNAPRDATVMGIFGFFTPYSAIIAVTTPLTLSEDTGGHEQQDAALLVLDRW